MVLGQWLKCGPRASSTGERDRPDVAAADVIIYTRKGCHLCDDAVEVLRNNGLQPRSVDIDSDKELTARYTSCVPVVVIDGREYFRGRVNEVLLRRLLRRRSASPE
jgi:glutaredoxin